jgi:hypothetical protein
MPALNGRGPAGARAMTGRRLGQCNTSQTKKMMTNLKGQ